MKNQNLTEAAANKRGFLNQFSPNEREARRETAYSANSEGSGILFEGESMVMEASTFTAEKTRATEEIGGRSPEGTGIRARMAHL